MTVETLDQLAQVLVTFSIIGTFTVLGVGYMIVNELKKIQEAINNQNKIEELK